MRSTTGFLVLAFVAAACNRPPQSNTPAMVSKSLSGVLAYPRSTVVDAASGTDAAQVTLTTLDSVGAVAQWYRAALKLNGWTLENDVRNGDGSVAITASKGSRPLWITLRPNVGGPGSTYTVIGAVVSGDSASVAESGAVKPPAR